MDAQLNSQALELRRFSRFYTQRVGLLDDAFLGEAITLPEARLLHDIGAGHAANGATLAQGLGLDPGYVSRLLKGLARRGLVARSASKADARAHVLTLTATGRALFTELERRSTAHMAALLRPLPEAARRAIAIRLRDIRSAFEPGETGPACRIRPMRAGDGGWVMAAFSRSLVEEFGLDPAFEAVVGQIVVDFIARRPHPRQEGWVAERAGETVGSVMLVEQDRDVAKLRLLVVTEAARGLGLGQMLIGECITFARKQGYRTITLWTHDRLLAARRLYAAAGFRCVAAVPAREFGQDVINETWELAL